MYINKLILENYKFVTRVFKTDRITLDFSNRQSNICIIAGPNGSGKTFILSALTPFANLGGVDARDDSSPVEKGRDGYKEIEIIHNGDSYLIRHFYTPTPKTHSVKSYILKNGEELNPNGNVTSFKQLVASIFDLTPNYMKLLRLGSNVKSLIEAKPTERKEVITEMLNTVNDTLEQMLNMNKVSSDNLRTVRQLMTNASMRLAKLHVSSVEDINTEIENLEEKIDDFSTELNAIHERKGSLTAELESLGNMQELASERREYNRRVDEMERALKRMPPHMCQSDIDDLIKETEAKKVETENEINALTAARSSVTHLLDEALNEKDEYTQILRKITDTEDEYEKLNKMLTELKTKCADKEEQYKDFTPQIKSSEVKEIIQELAKLQSKLDMVYSFGNRPMERVIDLMAEEKSVENYIQTQLTVYHLAMQERDHSSKIITELLDMIDVNPKLKCEVSGCPALMLYKRVNEMRYARVAEPEEDSEFLNYMKLINQTVNEVIDTLTSISPMTNRLPKILREDILISKALKRVRSRKPIYHLEEFNKYLIYLTDYEIFIEDKEHILNLELEIKKKSETNEGIFIKRRLAEVTEKSDRYRDELVSIKNGLSRSTEILEESQKDLSAYETWKEALLHKDEYTDKIDSITKSIDRIIEIRTELKDVIGSREKSVTNWLNEYQKNMHELVYIKQTFIDLSKDLEGYQKTFDQLNMIKKATSTKEGIPMRIVDSYLKKIRATVNSLLEVGYPDDEIRISEFTLTADDFRIPYYVNYEYLVEDVMYASQGEQTFIGTALSIAIPLLRKEYGGSNYNIYYFDEVDAPLDSSRSARWIDFLDNVFNEVGIEQAFVITHKNMFSSYLVDLVVTNPMSDGTSIEEMYPLSNQIEIVKELID